MPTILVFRFRQPSLEQSAQCGSAVARLLDVEKPVIGVTSGKLRRELSMMGKITGPKDLSLAVTVGWGHIHSERQVVMPGRGLEKQRDFTEEEKATLAQGASELNLSPDQLLAIFGGKTVDIYMNNETFWSNVPLAVWDYTIGGYLVLKKWLSYREQEVLGRAITKDEAREFTQMVRRVAALLLVETDLDKNYIRVKSDTYSWPAATE